MCGTPTWDPGGYLKLAASMEGKTSSEACQERKKMSKVIASQCLENHTMCKWQLIPLGENFRVRTNFRVLNLRGPTPTTELSENKTLAKISGSTVLVNFPVQFGSNSVYYMCC